MDLTLDQIPFIGKWKAYTAGVLLMLGGLHGLLDGVVQIVSLTEQLLTFHIGIFQYASSLETAAVSVGMFAAGLAAIGLRHGQNKAAQDSANAILQVQNSGAEKVAIHS